MREAVGSHNLLLTRNQQQSLFQSSALVYSVIYNGLEQCKIIQRMQLSKWVGGTCICQVIDGLGSSYVCLHTNLCDGSVFYNKISQLIGQQKGPIAIQSHSRLIINICFSYFINADITSELKNCTFAEIMPRTFYPLYGRSILSNRTISKMFKLQKTLKCTAYIDTL